MSSSPDVLSNKHATVTVTVETVERRIGVLMDVPVRFVVIGVPKSAPYGSNRYVATLSACGIVHGAEDERVPCPRSDGHSVNGKTSVDAWLEHSRHTCHGWHIDSARLFAEKVLATYGAKKPKLPAPPTIRYRDAFVPLRELVSA